MEIPRHWVRVWGQAGIPGRGLVDIGVWGWSSDDEREARALAEKRLAAALARLRGDGPKMEDSDDDGKDARVYPRERLPVREEIVRDIRSGRDKPSGVVTRARYGSLVLNCESALFIDVDLPRPNPLVRLARALHLVRDDSAARVLERLRGALAEHGEAFRIYRTAAGFRALATEREYDPVSEETQALMRRVRADVAFARLCRMQKSFRARLTPKPWRCGLTKAPGSHPREDSAARDEFEAWRARYDVACGPVATCSLAAEIGTAHAHPAIAPLLVVHDELTKVGSNLPLG